MIQSVPITIKVVVVRQAVLDQIAALEEMKADEAFADPDDQAWLQGDIDAQRFALSELDQATEPTMTLEVTFEQARDVGPGASGPVPKAPSMLC